MATLEERVSALEDALANDFANPLKAVTVQLDEQGRDLREQGRDVRELGRDMREVKARLAAMDTRLNRVDEKFDSLREEMNLRFEQVIALLAQRN